MAEKIVEKIEILNEQAKILLARRKKKNNLPSYIKKKTFAPPLTFSFQAESKEALTDISPSIPVSQSREDKLPGITKTKRNVSLENESEPRKSDFEKLNVRLHAALTNIKNQENKSIEPIEENRKSRCDRTFFYLKDLDEIQYAKPLRYLFLQHRQEYISTLGSAIFSPIPSIQSNVYKKEKVATSFTARTGKKIEEYDAIVHLKDYANKRKISLQREDFCTKETKSVRIDPLSDYHSVGEKSLLPLCFNDELKKPNTKIINISPAKTVTAHKEQNDTNPIIFHETRYVQKFLLTKNRFLLHFMENRDTEREILKPLINNQYITSSKPKRTMPTAWRKHMQVIPFAMGRGVIEDKVKKKSTMQTSKNISGKSYSFSEPFSSLTKKLVDFLGKTATQETSAKIGKVERTLYTVKPTSKFSASKPLRKNILQVHKIQTVTPLDDLLTFSSKIQMPHKMFFM